MQVLLAQKVANLFESPRDSEAGTVNTEVRTQIKLLGLKYFEAGSHKCRNWITYPN